MILTNSRANKRNLPSNPPIKIPHLRLNLQPNSIRKLPERQVRPNLNNPRASRPKLAK